MNVLSAERYSTIPDEVLSMVAGDFGLLPGEISPQILEKAETQQRKRVTPKDESLSQLRVRLGKNMSDEELLLKALMPSEQVNIALRGASPGKKRSFIDVVMAKLAEKELSKHVTVSVGDANFSLRR